MGLVQWKPPAVIVPCVVPLIGVESQLALAVSTVFQHQSLMLGDGRQEKAVGGTFVVRQVP